MDSKISLKIIFSIFSIFLTHLFLYYFFPTYGNYFKNAKYEWNVKIESITDSKWNTVKEIPNKKFSSYTWSNYIIPDINENTNNNDVTEQEYNVATSSLDNTDTLSSSDSWEVKWSQSIDETESTVDLSDNSSIQEVLDLFSDYDLKAKEETQNSSLFWLTNEYPYEYLEYYSRDKKMSLYVFKDKAYKDILNIFDVISYNLFFKIKKVNNFWEKSFYINLDADLDDNYVRIVFSYKNSNFGLKIKKDWYNEVKKILKSISN